jgi:hypothetical protein
VAVVGGNLRVSEKRGTKQIKSKMVHSISQQKVYVDNHMLILALSRSFVTNKV